MSNQNTKIENFTISFSDKGSVTASTDKGSLKGIVLNGSKLYLNDDNGIPKFSLLHKENSIAEIRNNHGNLSIISLISPIQSNDDNCIVEDLKCKCDEKEDDKKFKCDEKSIRNAVSNIKQKLNDIKNKLPLKYYFLINGDINEIYEKLSNIIPDHDRNIKEYNGLQWLCYPVYYNADLSLLNNPMKTENVSEWEINTGSKLANEGVISGNSYEFGSLIESTTSTNSSNVNAFGTSQYQYSVIWRGYFKPNISGSWNITTVSDDYSHIWINNDINTPITSLDDFSETNPSACGITTSNALVSANVSSKSASASFTVGKIYEIIIIYGQNKGGSNFSITMSDPNKITVSSNFSGMFINYESN